MSKQPSLRAHVEAAMVVGFIMGAGVVLLAFGMVQLAKTESSAIGSYVLVSVGTVMSVIGLLAWLGRNKTIERSDKESRSQR